MCIKYVDEAGGLIVILFTICNKLPLVHLRYDGHDIFDV